MQSDSGSSQKLDTEAREAEEALFGGKVQAMVATFYENERPLTGLAGLLDWRFHGLISQCIRAGAISGKEGECVYLPATKNGATYHLILIGAGQSEKAGVRQQLPGESLKVLERNLSRLNFPRVGISAADFSMDAKALEKHLKSLPLTVLK